MSSRDPLEQRLNLELESISWNQLSDLGSYAIKLGLIIGHGYHQGQYEILHREGARLMSPDEATAYLQTLIRESTQRQSGDAPNSQTNDPAD